MVLQRDLPETPSPPAQAPPRSGRSWGVDFGRAVAALAVVVIHACAAGDGVVRPSTATMRELLNFAVPFFLATSAVFAVRSISATRSAWAVARQRLSRLLLPYAVWTLIYVGLKAASSKLATDPERLQALFRDPGRLVLLGGASVQLYFLPMLAVGMLVLPLVDAATRRLRYRADTIGLLAASIVPYWYLGWTGNAYDIAAGAGLRSWVDPGRTRAIDSVARVAIVALVWAARLLPYLALGVLVRAFNLDRRRPRVLLVAAAIVFVTVEVGFRPFQPHILRELGVACPLLLVGFALRSPRAEGIASRAIASVAKHSFGIFLAHTAVLQVVQDVTDRAKPGFLDQITPGKVLVTAVPTFLLAWVAAVLIDRIKPLRRLLVAG
jgi:peptidoglycan/LPS O-acetylase OafA/YrhL